MAPEIVSTRPTASCPRANAAGKNTAEDFVSVSEETHKNERDSADPFEVLSELWEKLLGHKHLTEESDFFELGGDSLLITHLARDLRQRLNVQVPLRTLLSARTLGGQADVIAELMSQTAVEEEAC